MPLPALQGSFREGQGVQGGLLARDGRQDRAVRRRAHRPLELHQVQTDVNRGGKIGHLNFVKGDFAVIMAHASRIGNQNKVSSLGASYHDVCLTLGSAASINVKHLLDMTDSISVGDGTTLAGVDTQIWAHGFYFSHTSSRKARVDAPVAIGRHCYVGARCTIMPGVAIGDGITVGACCCIPKSLNRRGLYVGQGLRFVEFDADEKIARLGSPVCRDFIYRKN